MIITQTFTMARRKIVVKTSEATKETKTKMTTTTKNKNRLFFFITLSYWILFSNLCVSIYVCVSVCVSVFAWFKKINKKKSFIVIISTTTKYRKHKGSMLI